ncbi:MAG: hypothetical protein U9P10_03190 [Thermodesulfobacteriota bacterium]|nr:hypothetical protein [Thermodesulfobacteriota bacterium]
MRIIGEIVRAYGSEQILINATGGYKAQISFAGMIGQALDIPVCYMFERFAEVIELPPQPVSLDLGFWIENAGKHKGLSAWLEKVKGISFVNSIYTFYYNPDLNQQNTFTPDQKKSG